MVKVWECSRCKIAHPMVFKYCPYCGSGQKPISLSDLIKNYTCEGCIRFKKPGYPKCNECLRQFDLYDHYGH